MLQASASVLPFFIGAPIIFMAVLTNCATELSYIAAVPNISGGVL